MRLLEFVGPGTGPTVPAGRLTASYDFSSGACEVSEVDALILLAHCGRSFRDITNATAISYMVTRQTDTTAPVIASAAVNGKTLVLTYTEAAGRLNSSDTADKADFEVLVGGVANPVKSVVVAGNTISLTLTTLVVHGSTVTISYTQQTEGAKQIKDLKGNKAANLTTQAVTNSTPDIAAPVLASATVNGANLVLTYTDTGTLNTTLKAAPASFAVTVNGTARTVSSNTVHASNKTCTLVLASAVTAGQTVIISYTAPTTGTAFTQDAAGNKAANFANQAVTNQTA